MRRATRRPEPPRWLVHPLRWQRLPVPWAAMARGVLGMGPVLALAVATGHRQAGVLAGLGAMFAGINDRPGTRRTGLRQIGVPALAGALGLLLGRPGGWWVLPLLFAVGLVSGAISVAGPVSSAAAIQLLVLTIVASGMPLALPGWARAGWFLVGALWLLLLSLLLHPARAVSGRHAGERLAVAAVFDALADALDAVGTPGAEPARRRLTVALDKADEALRLHQLLRRPGPLRAGEQRLTERFAAAAALCEASVALLWEGERLPPRLSSGPRRLAEAVRADANPGRLPAPVPDSAARSAFDRAVLQACLAFGSAGSTVQPPPGNTFVRRRRGVHPLGPAGREYGLRVAVCVTASAAVALLLRADHAYWLPATAAFLVKPDYGPLFSRVVNRFVGTGAAVLLFALVAGVLGGPWWPVALVAGCGALIPPAARHFALQTAVVTLTVLGFVSVGGDTQAAGARLADTAIACAIVLLVGHLPGLADTRVRVGHRTAHALRHTLDYLDHVLTDGQDEQQHPERRADLRRAAYHSLAEARAAAESAAAELAAGAQHDWLGMAAGAERIADAATACAVRMEHGAPRPAEPTVRQVTEALAAVADALDGRGPTTPELGPAAPDCRTLDDILTELHRIQALALTPA
ncbi:FUSC family protein [Kitasatospora azatica]|uniref:FUSC family protein n=1 Tax=Kitasatospora azatica TaxID=58347 RepID=UPI00056505DE|nr:FUSC family protein [Kitasatospora azatica]